MKRKLLLIVLAASVAIACRGDHRTPLLVYSPHGRDLLTLMQRSFEALHPDIAVHWLDMGSQDVYDRVRSETSNPQGDVWYGGPRSIFARGAEDGLLQPYRPPWAEAIPEASRHPANLFFSVYRTAPVLVYNSSALKASEAPADWDDLLDPRFHGRLLMRDPLASGTMRTVFGMILSRSLAETGSTARGFDWLRRLDDQTKEYLQNPALLIEKLDRREGLITVWELTDMLWQKQRGAPLDFRFPRSGTPVIDDSIGLIKGAAHPEAAKLFIDYVGSVEAQTLAAVKAYRLPARTDLPADRLPPWARQVLADLVPAHFDTAVAERHGQEWMMSWDRTVRGRGSH
jgi:iron(III) transport system substrate-binding protein